MTTTYEQTTVTQSSSSGGGGDIRPDPFYVKSIPGILKIVEIVLCIIVLICASIINWWSVGGGWVQFVAASALIITILLFIFHFMHIISRLPGPWVFIEFIYYCIITVMWLIAAIVAASRIGRYYDSGSIIATTIFAFAATGVYAVDTFFMYRGWQGGITTTTTSSSSGGVATTTTTSYETKTQY